MLHILNYWPIMPEVVAALLMVVLITKNTWIGGANWKNQ